MTVASVDDAEVDPSVVISQAVTWINSADADISDNSLIYFLLSILLVSLC